MPCYNAAKWLEESLESLRKQTEGDFEVMVVDDGSSDDSCAIVERFATKDPRIRLERLPENSGGCYLPRKHGITLTKAEWIAPLDADDIVDADYLERLLLRAKETGADIVYPTMYTYDGITSTPTITAGDFDTEAIHKGRDIVKDTLGRWKFGAGGGILRRELYMNCYDRYDSSIHYNFADETLTRQLLYEAKRVAFSPAPYYYRINPESTSRQWNARIFELLRSQRDVADFVRKHYADDSETTEEAEKWVFHGFFDAIRLLAEIRHAGYETPEIRRTAIRELRESRNRIDRRLLRGKVSGRYRMLERLGVRTNLILLPLLDRLMK